MLHVAIDRLNLGLLFPASVIPWTPFGPESEIVPKCSVMICFSAQESVTATHKRRSIRGRTRTEHQGLLTTKVCEGSYILALSRVHESSARVIWRRISNLSPANVGPGIVDCLFGGHWCRFPTAAMTVVNKLIICDLSQTERHSSSLFRSLQFPMACAGSR
jgi:hypothetical protein